MESGIYLDISIHEEYILIYANEVPHDPDRQALH